MRHQLTTTGVLSNIVARFKNIFESFVLCWRADINKIHTAVMNMTKQRML